MSKTIQNLVYILITAMVIGAVWLVQPRAPVEPQGIFLPTSVSDIQHTGVTGHISIMMAVNKHLDSTLQQQQLLDYASQLAKTHGADKIQVQIFASTMSPGSSPPLYVLKALAVRSNS